MGALPGKYGALFTFENGVVIFVLNGSFRVGCWELLLEEENALKASKEGLLVCMVLLVGVGKGLFDKGADGKEEEGKPPELEKFCEP